MERQAFSNSSTQGPASLPSSLRVGDCGSLMHVILSTRRRPAAFEMHAVCQSQLEARERKEVDTALGVSDEPWV